MPVFDPEGLGLYNKVIKSINALANASFIKLTAHTFKEDYQWVKNVQ